MVPLLLVIVASYQLYKSQTTFQSQWKGGGFGMYTDIHPLFNKITINDSIIVTDTIFRKGAYQLYNLHKNQFLLYPNQTHLEKFISTTKLYNEDSLKINIYAPNVSLGQHTLKFKKMDYEGFYFKN